MAMTSLRGLRSRPKQSQIYIAGMIIFAFTLAAAPGARADDRDEIARLNGALARSKYECRALEKQYAEAKWRLDNLRHALVPVSGLNKKIAYVYQLLGVAYTQIKRYDIAIDAYKRSLRYNFKNPTVHYNLGMLYQYNRSDSKKAIYHLSYYLSQNPDAVDKKEVKFIIKRLSEVDDDDIVFFN